MKLTNIILPAHPRSADGPTTYDILIDEEVITSITPHAHAHTPTNYPTDLHSDDRTTGQSCTVDRLRPRDRCPAPSLLLPTLCHPHIHLDKAYLLNSHYGDGLGYPECCPRPGLEEPLDLEQSLEEVVRGNAVGSGGVGEISGRGDGCETGGGEDLNVETEWRREGVGVSGGGSKEDATKEEGSKSKRYSGHGASHENDGSTHSRQHEKERHSEADPSSNPPPLSPIHLPDYSSLAPQTGSFPEALELTSKAKSLYTLSDLYLRGSQLLATSYTQGVTSARCFVEIDNVTTDKALRVGLALKKRFEEMETGGMRMRVQICAFAQDPVFSGEKGSENRGWMERCLERYAANSDGQGDGSDDGKDKKAGLKAGRGVEVLGSTPYVEQNREASIRNIEWAVKTALKYDLHLDFHLDYNLDENKKAEELMIWEVLRLLRDCKWPTRVRVGGQEKNDHVKRKGSLPTVVLGHCSALTLLSHEQLLRLSKVIRESALPIYFVGLPTSDIYMMGRPPHASSQNSTDNNGNDAKEQKAKVKPLNRPRGTVNSLCLQKDYGLDVCLGVNNVGNAFTPFGTGDPLALASWGVGLYHGGGEWDAEKLYECVASGARRAIGLEKENADGEGEGEAGMMKSFEAREGQDIGNFGLLLVENGEYIGGNEKLSLRIPARRKISVRDVVWDVPEVRLRRVIR